MRSATWLGWVLMLAACTRPNAAFDGGGTKTDTADEQGPGPGSSQGTGGADGATTANVDITDSRGSEEGPLTTGGSMGSTEDGETTAGPPPQDCCVPSPAPGCGSRSDVEAGVCAVRPECCANGWDPQCVELVALLGFDQCGLDIHQCCTPSFVGGCGLAFMEACVCELDAFCCVMSWHPGCIALAVDECLAPCEPPSNCCYPHAGGGCDDVTTEECVCNVDPGCCGDAWAVHCAMTAGSCPKTVCQR